MSVHDEQQADKQNIDDLAERTRGSWDEAISPFGKYPDEKIQYTKWYDALMTRAARLIP